MRNTGAVKGHQVWRGHGRLCRSARNAALRDQHRNAIDDGIAPLAAATADGDRGRTLFQFQRLPANRTGEQREHFG